MKRKPHRFALYILIRTLIFILRPIPLKISSEFGAALGRLIFYILPKEREKTLTHLTIAFGRKKTASEIRGIGLSLYANLGRNAMEWVNVPKLDNAWFDKNVTPEGLHHIDEARSKGKGTIVLASHFGNWELLSLYLNRLGCFGIIIVRKIYIEQLNRIFDAMRKIRGNEIMYRDESPRRILKTLKKNGYIGLLADQDVKSVEGVFVDFFGKPAYTPVAPVKFAMKTKAALIPMFMAREGKRFRFFVEKEIEIDDTGDEERDLLVNTVRWTRVLERYILKYPDQWVWMHRRWKTKPAAVTSKVMQDIDRAAQEEHNIPGITLMENAGEAAAACALEMLGAAPDEKKVLVVCGKGNNGGDGFVIARKLLEKGIGVTTYTLCGANRLKADPLINFNRLRDIKAEVVIIDREGLQKMRGDLSRSDLIIDSIFGTGFKGRPDDMAGAAIEAINSSGKKVLAVDVPSGLDATTGRCGGECVKADRTVTFGLPKTGFFEASGPGHSGKLVVKNIGFPDSLLENLPE
jgi:hydroxyethylthiazole kinase-like uncharacterized protein yjeF